MRLIGLNGKKRRGKNATASIIADFYSLDEATVREASFARALKVSFARLFLMPGDQSSPPWEGWTDDEMVSFADHFKEHAEIRVPEFEGGTMSDGYSMHAWGPFKVSGREALQKFGTESHRDVFGPDFWVDQVLPTLPFALSTGALPKGRTPLGDRLLAEGYPDVDVLLITDVRFPNEARRVLALGGEVWEIIRPELDEIEAEDGHASEQPLPRELVSATLVNDGTLYDLRQEVKLFLGAPNAPAGC